MKPSAIFIVVLLFVIKAGASQDFYRLSEGEEPKSLTPPSIYGELDYDTLLKDKLLGRYGRGQLGTMLVMPAFTAEYCVSIYGPVKSNNYSLDSKFEEQQEIIATAAKASCNLYGWLQRKKDGEKVSDVEVTHSTRKVSRELAVAFQRVWSRAILRTRYPDVVPPRIMDGISYRFSVVLGIGEICGEAHNPEKGHGKDMAEIGHKLYNFVTSNNPKGKKEEDDLILSLQHLETTLE